MLVNQSPLMNRRITLQSRPAGAPAPQNFRLEEVAIPAVEEGQVRLKTLLLSLDPYMRGRMSDAPSYAAPVEVGSVMCGGTVSRVEESKNPKFQPGDLVLSYSGWQSFEVTDGKGVTKLDPQMKHPSLALGVLGMPGFTAYMGLLDIGQPKQGETVVVAAASGAVGSVVGQIAKIKGCRVVGIAGGADKCRFVKEELGFDVCLDRRTDLKKALAASCPNGIDVYFENVGGAVFDAVMPLLNVRARVPLCGLISHYNDTQLPEGPNRLPQLTRTILTKRIKIQGYIITEDYRSRFGEFYSQMSAWVTEGLIKTREDFVDGLENAPQAFIGLLEGKNFGKLIVRVSDH